MRKVNIYIYNPIKGPIWTDAIMGYVLETVINKKTYTSDGFMYITNTTRNKAELIILSTALKHLKEKCELHIYSDNDYVSSYLANGWPMQWIL